MSLPADRGHLSTEQPHPDSAALDELSTRQCVDLMVRDHTAVQVAVENAAEALAGFIDALVQRMKGGGRLVYLGAGTSGRLGVLDAAECPPTFQSDPQQVIGIIAGGDAALRRSSEGKEDDQHGAVPALEQLNPTAADTLLGIAAGGTTPYVLGGLAHACSRGTLTALLTCAADAKQTLLQRKIACDHLIVLDTGPEVLTGSTRIKAGSATKLALNIITTTAFTRLGKVYSNLMVDLRATNSKLTDRAIRILIELCPHLTRPEAAQALTRAGGELKTAIVMVRRGIDAAHATALLAAHDGALRSVV